MKQPEDYPKEHRISPMLRKYRAVNAHILEVVRREGYEVRPKTPQEINQDLESVKKSKPHLLLA